MSHAIAKDLPTGTIVFQDGTQVSWTFEEYVPYEPSAYQTDEGIIVWVQSEPNDPDKGNSYYISLSDGSVWTLIDDEETRRIDATCPEVTKRIDDFIAMMGS